MSIELELEENGEIRVRLDTAGERAISDTFDPVELIVDIVTAAHLQHMMTDTQLIIDLPAKEETSA